MSWGQITGEDVLNPAFDQAVIYQVSLRRLSAQKLELELEEWARYAPWKFGVGRPFKTCDESHSSTTGSANNTFILSMEGVEHIVTPIPSRIRVTERLKRRISKPLKTVQFVSLFCFIAII